MFVLKISHLEWNTGAEQITKIGDIPKNENLQTKVS
jgi:hypothetical protein